MTLPKFAKGAAKGALLCAAVGTGTVFPIITAIAIWTGRRTDREIDEQQRREGVEGIKMPILPDRYI
jgi:hypothetical protein